MEILRKRAVGIELAKISLGTCPQNFVHFLCDSFRILASVCGADQELAHTLDSMNTKCGHALIESLCVDSSWNERDLFVCAIAG